MLVGYIRVSKADGSQVFDSQRDALLAAGVRNSNIYEDQVSGRKDDRPGLDGCLKALREGDRARGDLATGSTALATLPWRRCGNRRAWPIWRSSGMEGGPWGSCQGITRSLLTGVIRD
jgi:hypothetical protein